MSKSFAILGLSLTAVASAAFGQTPDPIVRFTTSLGDIDVQLSPADAPLTVANFLKYVDAGSYADSIFHRSVANFVIQGGGYYISNGQLDKIAQMPPVALEYHLPNARGTIAMARTSALNSATDEWFFNTVDNSTTLDTSNGGGYAVFGHIVNTDSLAVMDAIAALQVVNASASFGSDFTTLPVIDYTSGNLSQSNLVEVASVTRLTSHPAFFDGEVSVGNAVNYLAFADGTPFGYYSYLTDQNYIYHFDLGYEYVFDAQDGKAGVYLYDFASDTFFYTSPTFPFPYLYDFTLDAVLYYFPDTTSAGHYTANPRYFYNFATGQIITK